MTNDQQRVAIAKACGWTSVRFHLGYFSGVAPGQKRPILTPIHNYTADLNAMHEAWLGLSLGDKFLFADQLFKVVERDYDAKHGKGAFEYLGPTWQMVEIANATAPQRAEAFLRTIGKLEKGTAA